LINGFATGYMNAREQGIDPWTGKPNQETTVIEETMKRVNAEASNIPGSRTLSDMPDFTCTDDQRTSQMIQYNRKWILGEMRSGNTILDIGLDINRTYPNIFYQMEQNMIKNYQILYPSLLNVIVP